MARLEVRKTYKLYVGGAFVRSESGRYDRHDDRNVPRGSRKDIARVNAELCEALLSGLRESGYRLLDR